jgi:hypothetical protein
VGGSKPAVGFPASPPKISVGARGGFYLLPPTTYHQFLGDSSVGVPPVPIPNTEVKPYSPDGTARASVWESRKLPGLKTKAPADCKIESGAFLFTLSAGPQFRERCLQQAWPGETVEKVRVVRIGSGELAPP